MVTRLVTAPPIDFGDLRRELELPTQFPLAAQREADAAARRPRTGPGIDRTALRLVTIDPPASRDLDQALAIQRRPSGYRVSYAIADVSAFVAPGGALEAETWRRGQTIYLPDGNVPLHPLCLSQGAASLLPGQVRPAVLWTIDVDAGGEPGPVRLERAVVRSRAKLDYASVQAAAANGSLDGAISALPELGRLLIARALARGAINLPIPEQEVTVSAGGGWRLQLRSANAAEDWNAQISLLTGRAAATIMLDGGVGLLRTMPEPRPQAVQRLRVAARGLGVDWPAGATVGQVLAAVDPATSRGAAFVDHAAELLRGAGYTAFAGEPPVDPGHGAVAAPYAHVTAPLRRLADRYATEACLGLVAGRDVPDWVRQALPQLPDVMSTTDRTASAAERGAVDLAEAVLLQRRVGEEFDAAVLDVDAPRARAAGREPGGVVVLDDPPVRARCVGELQLGQRIRVRLITADPARRLVGFEAATRPKGAAATRPNGESMTRPDGEAATPPSG